MIYDGERIEICILVCFSIAANPLEQKKCNHEAKKKKHNSSQKEVMSGIVMRNHKKI